jgi:malate dehydrogenase (oxaloacetate-decarboxylating)(NADP+)
VVGEACQRFSHIYVNPEGLHISLKDKGHIYEILERYPIDDLEITVVTDGSRILGLGDLGLNGTISQNTNMRHGYPNWKIVALCCLRWN